MLYIYMLLLFTFLWYRSASNLKSWSEFDSFVQFLNVQLLAIERSIFCKLLGCGFKSFVIKMMIEMSKVIY